MKQLYDWQAAALESGEAGRNLVYCAPTSGGKTAVAEVLMIRKLIATATPHKFLQHKKVGLSCHDKVHACRLSCRIPAFVFLLEPDSQKGGGRVVYGTE